MKDYDDFRLASDPLTPPEVLYRLSKNEAEEVRGAVALNPSSDNKTLLGLVGDSSSHVIGNLMENENKLTKDIEITSCKNIILTLVNTDDSEFVLSLRQNEDLNRFVSQVSPELSQQQKWIESYKKREAIRSEFYFIIRDINRSPLGTVRLYDFQSDSFCWGSWMVSPCSPRKTAIESALCVYEFAFYTLGFRKSHFDVRNENEKVIKFHKRMGAKELRQDDKDTFFIFEKADYEKTRDQYNPFFS